MENTLQDKLTNLRSENDDRAKQVRDCNTQIERLQVNISSLKEAHDHTRGKIDILNELISEQEPKAAPGETT
jgi:peptidoglycan hydrolase CwlO-like protein